MSANSDFVIENGVLLEYKGPGGEVIIPEGVTEIPILRFEHCNHLTRVVLPESLQSINIRAFYDCINLKEVVISKNVSYIGEGAFDSCERLERIIVDEENETFRVQNGLLMAGTTVEVCPGGLRGVCQIPEGTTRISSFAFSGCHRLTEIRIPDTVIGIGKSAFRQCVRLKRLTFPPKLKYILGRLCLDCENLREIVLPESVKEIENAAFQHCGLLRVSLLGKAVKMDGYVFGEGNFALFAPDFPLADLKPIYRLNAIRAFLNEEAAFSDERRAEYLKYIKTNRKKLLPTALEWPELLRLMLREEMLKPEEVERLVGETTAANRTELTAELLDYQNRIFPMEKRLEAQEKQLKRQARQLERELKQLESGELPEPKRPKLWRTGKDEKGNLIILGYKGEESEIEVPAVIGKDKVTAIGDYAFSPNGKPLSEAQRAVRRGIRSIRVPEGILTIGTSAFENCEGLERVELPASVRKIGGSSYLPDDYKPKPKKTDDPFSGCPALSAVLVAEDNRWYCMEDGLLCRKSKSGKKMLRYVGGGQGVCVVPEGTKTIPDYFFQKHADLTAVSLPEGVDKIGRCAFRDCTGLTSMTIPEGASKIGMEAFSGCTGLTSVTILEGVTEIGHEAFHGCTSLTSVILPTSMTAIDEYAFSGCTSLTGMTIPEGVTTIGRSAFSGCTGLTNIILPTSMTAINWDTFSGCTGLTSMTIPEGVSWIGSSAFSGCTGLTSMTIPESVTEIGDVAFRGCTGLTNVTIPVSVTKIGEWAFSGCTGLTSITIPESVTEVGTDAFGKTPWLEQQKAEHDMVYAGRCVVACRETLVHADIREGTERICKGAFFGCTALTGVTIPASVTRIDSNAFSGCTGLTSVTIPEGVAEIESDAFSGCTALTGATIPASVTEIGWWAFHGCEHLTIHAPAGSYAQQYAQRNNIRFEEG